MTVTRQSNAPENQEQFGAMSLTNGASGSGAVVDGASDRGQPTNGASGSGAVVDGASDRGQPTNGASGSGAVVDGGSDCGQPTNGASGGGAVGDGVSDHGQPTDIKNKLNIYMCIYTHCKILEFSTVESSVPYLCHYSISITLKNNK